MPPGRLHSLSGFKFCKKYKNAKTEKHVRWGFAAELVKKTEKKTKIVRIKIFVRRHLVPN